ncbi:MAG: hypothetical protein A3E01_05445 [Gammaproteobacteria bacterium RIFCSPHIGHO2_12_FULL_63_22]|nr:MAG: hypothetical protein A3E01_05445 [Gammaproteobacteria bacterium RIFCSPHIGHO2_12_FULL_63_22]
MYIKADRILSGITGGAINSAQLQALLADPGYLGAFRSGILYSPPRRDVLLASPQAAAVVAGSALAVAELLGKSSLLTAVLADSSWFAALVCSPTAVPLVYASATGIATLFGADRKAVFAPHAAQMTLSGSEVTAWRDYVGATQLWGGAAGARPTFDGPAPNGFTSVAFDGVNDALSAGPSGLFAAAATTFYVVVRPTTMTSDRVWIAEGGAGGGYIGSSGTGGVLQAYSGGTYNFAAPHVPTANTWQLYRLRKDSGSLYIKRNSSAEVSAGAMTFNAGAQPLIVGHRLNGSSVPERFFAGQIAEIVNLGKSAGDADADNIRITELLRSKYALW